jgi:hypothetical protein
MSKIHFKTPPPPIVHHADTESTPNQQGADFSDSPNPPVPGPSPGPIKPPVKSTIEILKSLNKPITPSVAGSSSSNVAPSMQLNVYMIKEEQAIKLPQVGIDGLRSFKGLKFADIKGGGTVQVVSNSDGTVRAKLRNEHDVNASGPVLYRNVGENRWSEKTTAPILKNNGSGNQEADNSNKQTDDLTNQIPGPGIDVKTLPGPDSDGLHRADGKLYAQVREGPAVEVKADEEGLFRTLSSDGKPTGYYVERIDNSNSFSLLTTRPKDGVTYYKASAEHLKSYSDAGSQIDEMSVPLMHRKNDPDSRLFVVAFDGTGNDGDATVQGRSNVAEIAEQYKYEAVKDPNIAVSYIEGPGTQNNPIAKGIDQAIGKTYSERQEKMYADLQAQAQKWYKENPNIRISVANVGFSRGAEQAAGFSLLIHERGIIVKDGNGQDVNLVEKKQVIQAVALFDPVGTGVPHTKDRSQPDSVVSGLQIRAKDEKRDQFKDTASITNTEPNSPFRVVEVNGSHSDIGGGYTLNGLSIRSGDLMRQYLNGLTDVKLNMRHEPNSDHLDAIHRSEEGLPKPIYTTKDYEKNQGRVSVSNGTSSLFNSLTNNYFSNRKKLAPSIEPLSGIEHKLTFLPIGAKLSEPSEKLLQSSRDAVKNLNQQLNPPPVGEHLDEPSSQISAFAAFVARQARMGEITRMELTPDATPPQITIYWRHKQGDASTVEEKQSFDVRTALEDSENTHLRRIAEFDASNPVE